MFSGHDGIKLGINNRKLSGQTSNIWKLNYICLCNPWIKKEVKEKLGKKLIELQ